MPKSRKTSEIWNHFSEQGNEKAECNYCKTKLSVLKGSTGNLTRHMRLKHPGR